MEKVEEITITSEKQIEDGWLFMVVINTPKGKTEHTVTIGKEYWQTITQEKVPPVKLVKASLEFLLDRESNQSILDTFDLKIISEYFPEYEETIKKAL